MHARPVLATLAAVSLALGLGVPALATPAPVAPDHGPRAELPPAASDRAHQALAHVRALFDNNPTTGTRQRAAEPSREATLALRDLVRLRGELRASERGTADSYLSRPSTTRKSCTKRICVHYNPGSVSRDGGDANKVSDYVDKVRRTIDGVHRDYTAAGYRAPRADGTRGGDKRADVYLRDIGDQGLYGYCTTDKWVPNNGPYDAWAFCVLDNDYQRSEFPDNKPLDNMRVTAAHEYYHAVQFAYDAFEDGWFMEATATWAEDEVFDDINDNRQYLKAGPLRKPWIPLDKFGGSHHYGDWIFFRYLTEKFPGGKGMPAVVRKMWKLADGSRNGRDMYSMQAVRSVLADRGAPFARTFTEFADDNRRPATTYDEGAAAGYEVAQPWKDLVLDPANPRADLVVDDMDHQTSATARFTPTGMEKGSTLRINVRMTDKVRGSRAIVTSYRDGLDPHTEAVDLSSAGDGQLIVPFDDGSIETVEVTLVNASTRMDCWRNFSSPYSCLGTPRDDNLTQRVNVLARPA
jgi:hypothetical protein